MIKSADVIWVSYNGETVGRLVVNQKHLCVFEYTSEWVKNGFSISPFFIPLRTGTFVSKRDPFDGLFGVFEDSLPDGWGNLLIDRWLKEQGINPGSLSRLDRLALVGDSGMGALSYQPETSRKSDFDARDINFYANEVEKVLKEAPTDSLDHLVEKAGSPGGARPKVLLTIDGEEWMIKFRSLHDSPQMGCMEYDYSLAAKSCGVEMPETKLFDDKYFGVRRFDIEDKNRIHVHTASGLLHASHRYPSLDYIDLIKATLSLTKSKSEILKVFRLMVFNVLSGNKDDHAKNFTFLFKNSQWCFAPAYDLVYSIGFNGQHSTTIDGKGVPKLEDILSVAEQSEISKNDALNIVEEVKKVVIPLNQKWNLDLPNI
jgi:serine/threonine-protein kinase HipA